MMDRIGQVPPITSGIDTLKQPLCPRYEYKPVWVGRQQGMRDGGARGPPEATSHVAPREVAGICRGRMQTGNMKAGILRQLCEEGGLREAVEEVTILVQGGCHVGKSIFYRLLKRCGAQKDLVLGRCIHALARKSGYESNAFLANHFIGMYASHGRLEEAMQVFTMVSAPDCYMWASILLAYARHGQAKVAIQLYRQSRQSNVKPDNHIFVAVLKACAAAEDLVTGKEVHADILESAAETNIFVGNSLVVMYSKCGSLEDARRVFDRLPTRDVVTWNAMIGGYAQHGLGQEALTLYASMQQDGITTGDPVTFVSLLQACASVRALHQGRQLSAQVQQKGLDSDVVVGNSLVNMYAKCGSLEEARRVFDRLPRKDVVTWTAMIAGYVQLGLGQEALSLYTNMQQDGLCPANSVTFVCLVQACACIGALHQGKELHAQIQQRGLEADVVVGSCLVDMYAKCGSLHDARLVFDRLPGRDVVTWTTMIAGYMQHGYGQEALSLYAGMQQESMTPADHVTLGCLLQACTSVGALRQGEEIHALIRERGLEADVVVGSCLVDMYAKCGSLVEARRVFNRLPSRNVVTWNALLIGYAENGDGQEAIECYEDMLQQRVQPNHTTFICLLVACSHAGLVDQGKQYYKMMVEDFGIAPIDYHYNCMVDLLARSGHLDEAENMLHTLPFDNSLVGWTALLSACKSHHDIQRGERCFNRLVQLDPGNAAAYVLLGNIYANASRWGDVDKVESLRKSSGAWKKPAKACIEVKSKIHEFTVGDERSDISSKLRSLNLKVKDQGGHVPHTELVLKAVSELEKEDALCGHAEKLALAFGLLNTEDGTPLLVTKNLRMCMDCHSSTKIMSRLERRQIVVRDAYRIHRFINGSCSCNDKQ